MSKKEYSLADIITRAAASRGFELELEYPKGTLNGLVKMVKTATLSVLAVTGDHKALLSQNLVFHLCRHWCILVVWK